MRLKLSIRTPSLAKAIEKRSRESLKRALGEARNKIQALVVDRGGALVDKTLNTMAPRFKAALAAPGAVEVTETSVSLVVRDPVVLALDGGKAAYDLKAKLLAHAKRFSKKGVPYIDIPFQHKAGDVPRGIKNKTSRLAMASGSDTVRVPGNTPGAKFTKELQRGKVARALGLAPRKLRVEHKQGIHDDITRSAVRTGARSSVKYTTIRRISANSSPSAWQHPGFKPAKILGRILPSLKREIVAVLRGSLRGK